MLQRDVADKCSTERLKKIHGVGCQDYDPLFWMCTFRL